MTKRYLWIATLTLLVCQATSATAAERELVYKNNKWVKAAEPKEGTPAGEISLIYTHLNNKAPSAAYKATRKFLKRYPDHAGTEEVMMLSGQARMDQGFYYYAFEIFDAQLQRFSDGVYYERALQRQYEIADAFLKGKKRLILKSLWVASQEEGIVILEGLALRMPDSVIAEKSLRRIADYYYKIKKYQLAVGAYDDYLDIFPRSPQSPYAMLQAARATYAQYKGAVFDDTPLIDGHQRFKEYQRLYSANAQKQQIDRIIKKMQKEMMKRTLSTADFYRRVKRNKAAAYYYRMLVTQHPGTSYERKARNALKQMGMSVSGAAASGKTHNHPVTEAKAANDRKKK